MNQRFLTLKMTVAGVCRQPLLNGLRHTLLHLCRCRTGKGNHQQVINIHCILIRYQLYDTLYQHCRFA